MLCASKCPVSTPWEPSACARRTARPGGDFSFARKAWTAPLLGACFLGNCHLQTKLQRSARIRQARRAIQYSDGLKLGGRPASVWLPANGSVGTRISAYPYTFSSRKLSRSVLGLPLGSGPVVADVPTSCEVLRNQVPPQVTARAAVLVHGLLCSRLDLAHIAEALVTRGFTVVSPEMDDSVSHEEGVSPGGFVGQLLNREAGEARRREVTHEAVEWLRQRGADQVGLVGHSRGGVTVSQLDGDFCRVNIAGFQPPPVEAEETFCPSARRGPMLIVCGQDDEVCTRPPLSMQYVQDTVKRLLPDARTWYPAEVGHFSVLNPGVVSKWRPLLGLAGSLAPEPSSPQLAQAVAERVAAFLDEQMPAS